MKTADLASPLNIGAVRTGNRVFLAPMSGVTDLPFRERAQVAGAGLVVTEMIAGGELVKARRETAARLRSVGCGIRMVQLAGREPAAMAEAARMAEAEGAEVIDINMGCPAKKVVGGACGSALMREPDLAVGLVSAVVKAVRVPVTVKMRLGWDATSINAPALAAQVESVGAQMITVHGRTREQFYQGDADWAAVGAVKQGVTVPVVVNGDILCRADAKKALAASGADAVMIGRGAYGAPWMPGCVAAPARRGPSSPAALLDYVLEHYEAMLCLYGRDRGVRHARKHVGWYLDRHAPHAAGAHRTRAMNSVDPAEVMQAIRSAFDAPAAVLADAA